MSEPSREYSLADAQATEGLGAALARAFRASGADAAVLHLAGELGAGKTTLARSLLRALGVAGRIRSPTYTLVEIYEPDGLRCIHVDLYRLAGAPDVEALGLRDDVGPGTLLLVEWPEKGDGALPPPDLAVALGYRERAREVRLVSHSPRGRRWLDFLLQDSSLDSYVSNLT